MFTAAHTELEELVPAADRSGLCDQIAGLAALEAHLAERRLAVTAAIDALDDNGLSAADVNRSVGRCSARRAHRLADTAAAFATMPAATAALRTGAITFEHADALARAADDIDPGAVDEELVTTAAVAPADLFSRRARDWVNDRLTPTDVDERHQAQRARRTVRTWTDRSGLHWFLLGTDAISGAAIHKHLDHRVDRLWRADGGRDGTPDAVRTPDQRRADALTELICGHGTASGRTTSAATPGRHPRHQILAIAHATRLRPHDPTGTATLDGAPLPQAVLEEMACDAAITPILFGTGGEVLWQGRSHRTATPAQWKALIARDRGCVLCGAGPARCHAHHLVAWDDRGPTDITNLALVCTHHHTQLHHTGSHLTNRRGHWELRPGTGPPLELAA